MDSIISTMLHAVDRVGKYAKMTRGEMLVALVDLAEVAVQTGLALYDIDGNSISYEEYFLNASPERLREKLGLIDVRSPLWRRRAAPEREMPPPQDLMPQFNQAGEGSDNPAANFDPMGDSRQTTAAMSTVVRRSKRKRPVDDNEEGIAGVRRLLADMKRRGIKRSDVAHAFKQPTNPQLDRGDSASDAIDLTDD